ncbi:MAG: type IV pilin [Methanomicrobia archaeon]|nr:type IV pilin [Methanomicrobia archaeon]
MTTKRSMKKDDKAVSPVIGVIMMIAIVVIIAAVVAAFAYGIIGGVNKAPSSAMVVEGVSAGGTVPVTVFHHGGDTITDAFDSAEKTNMTDKWEYLEIRLNGVACGSNQLSALSKNSVAWNNASANWDARFAPGDQLDLTFVNLTNGDSIVILHTPSDNILQRITVS